MSTDLFAPVAVPDQAPPLGLFGVLSIDRAAKVIDDAADVVTDPDGHCYTYQLITWLYQRGYGIVETSTLLPQVPALLPQVPAA